METLTKADLQKMLEETLVSLEEELNQEIQKESSPASDAPQAEAPLAKSEEVAPSEDLEKKMKKDDDKEDDKEDKKEEDLEKPMKKAKMKKEEKKDDEHEDEAQDKKLIQEMIDESKKAYKMKKHEENEIEVLKKSIDGFKSEIEELKKSIESLKTPSETKEEVKKEIKQESAPAPASAAPLAKSEEVAPIAMTKEQILNKCFETLRKYEDERDNINASHLKQALNKYDLGGDESLVRAYIK